MIEQVYFDLKLDEITIILHSFLKQAKIKYATINVHIEKYYRGFDPMNPDDDNNRYTLIIIASVYRLPKHELLAIYQKICKANNIRYFKGDDA